MKRKILLGLLLLQFILYYCEANPVQKEQNELCETENLKCYQTEYKEYVKCIEKQRKKRQVCNFGNAIAPQVVATVADCSGVNCPQQATYVVGNECINSCSAACTGIGCNDRCSVSCQKQQPIIIQPVPQTIPQYVQPQLPQTVVVEVPSNPAPPSPSIVIPSPPQIVPAPAPNVTTVIKLTNIVNNTNVVNVPTSINNTNVNNLDLGSNSSSILGYGGGRDSNKCCTVVQPKVCSIVQNDQQKPIHKCVHRRHHTCGNVCYSQTMHAQVRQPCEGTTASCPPSIAYVPQPNPRCVYQPTWPYVNCGYRDTPTCLGCYDHYGYGFGNYHGEIQPDCTGCYDDGYDMGDLYRQGPFYRPGYYHEPPCYMTGTCDPVQTIDTPQMIGGPAGYFGHELIDPVFGYPSVSPYANYFPPHVDSYLHSAPYYPKYYPYTNPFNYGRLNATETEIVDNIETLPLDENAIDTTNATIYPWNPFMRPYPWSKPYISTNESVLLSKTKQ